MQSRRSLSRRDFIKLASLLFFATACHRIKTNPTAATATPPAPTHGLQGTPTTISNATPTISLQPAPTSSETPTAEPTSTSVSQAHYIPGMVIDGHQDVAWNALEFGRDPMLSAYLVRQMEAESEVVHMVGRRTTGLREYLVGRVGIVFATIFVMPRSYAYAGYTKMTYANSRQAEARAQEQMSFYQELAKKEPHFTLLLNKSDLETVLVSWLQEQTMEKARVGLLLCMEGAEPILKSADLPAWYQAGLRIVGPAWKKTRYAGGAGEPGPLTGAGRELLLQMAELKMVLDLSHMAEQAYLQAVDTYAGSLIASHSNPRKFLPGDRGVSDKMIKKLAARDGVLGVVLYNAYLKPGWTKRQGRDDVNLDSVADVIDHVVQLLGDAEHVAIGSDFDGGFGRESIPSDMDSIADLSKIGSALERRGYKTDEVQLIMNGNWLRVLRQVLV